MTKILKNKTLRRWFSVLLAFLLVVTLAPSFQAFGTDEDGKTDITAQEEGSDLTVSGAPEDMTTGSLPEVTDDVPAGSATGEEPSPDGAGDGTLTTQETEDEGSSEEGIVAQDEVNYNNDAAALSTALEKDNVNYDKQIVFDNGKKDKTNTVTIPAGKTLTATICVKADTKLYLEGEGTLNGNSKGSVIVVQGNGAELVLNEDKKDVSSGTGLTIIGGTGSGYSDLDGKIFDGAYKTVGGGIQVKRVDKWDEAKLVLYNGTIGATTDENKYAGNTANAGGGIFVDRNCRFEMYNGAVLGNTADMHEGGGIFSAAGRVRLNDSNSYGDDESKTAFINKGKINNNRTLTTKDWGGGGLFIEAKGSMKVGNIIVTSNIAKGLGGGISGCPHATMGIGEITGGAAIYGNTAKKEAILSGALYNMGAKAKTGDIIAYDVNKDGNNFTKEKAMDFYCTKGSIVYGTTTTWHGRVAYYDPQEAYEGQYGADVTIEAGERYAVEGASLGLTATPVSVPNRSSVAVQVIGNESSTHGGGIGCNGNLSIGSLGKREDIVDGWNIEFTKQFKKMNGETVGIQKDAYGFELYEAQQDGSLPSNDAQPLKTVTNDADGKVTFKMNGYKEGTYTFYAKEVIPEESDEFVNYDTAWRKVVVQINKQVTTATVFPDSVTTTRYFVPDNGIVYSVQNDAGTFVQSSGSGNDQKTGNTFVNSVRPKHKDSFEGAGQLIFNKLYSNNKVENIITDSSISTDKKFSFELYRSKTDADGKVIPDVEYGKVAIAQNDDQGNVTFNLEYSETQNMPPNDTSDTVYINFFPNKEKPNQGGTYTFFAKESTGSNEQIEYDANWHKAELTFAVDQADESFNGDEIRPVFDTVYTAYLANSSFRLTDKDGAAIEGEGQTFKNIFHPKGEFVLNAQKNYYGVTDAVDAVGKFHFSMTEVAKGPENNKLVLPDSLVESAVNGEFTDNNAQVIFPKVTYQEKSNHVGDHWYVLSETRSDIEGVELDPRYYVVKVSVQPADDGMSLTSEITEAYYAEGVTENKGLLGDTTRSLELTQIYVKGEGATLPTFEFNNFDTSQSMSVAGYSVNAASNEPLEEVCFVDPKIVKNLEGRTLKADEFNFKLIHLNKDDNLSDDAVNWSVTEGPVISETSNDRYGMVDFDAANNVSGNWENPSCLSYTQPGIYHYRVVEANDTIDPSVDYSKQIITFTTVIEYNAQGQLECTDMYYGYVDGNGYHRYTSKADDPTYEASDNWHPTMTNTAKTMTLKVQKTSALDRNRGLEGATYGLYAVNEGVQDDILIGEQTSDKEGWITFEDLSLNTAATYYFKERYAPAGHTVSEFRSPYFKVSQGADGYKVINIEDNAQAQSENEGIMAMAEEDAATPADDNGITIFAEGVYDEATLVEFAKLDVRTHEWVEGADLSIINKSTGEVVNRWTSGKANERLEGVLNVDTTYILRENTAPEGYAKADDVEFTIDQYGSVHMISGTGNNSAGLANAVLQDSTISLYDTMLDAEQVVTETRETPGQDDGGFLAKTGDFLKVTGIAALAVIALLGLIYAVRRARGHEN